MKVIIIEDEQPASNLLDNILQQIDEHIEIVKILRSVREAVSYLKANANFDILFLDVELSDGSSFEIFKQITEFSKPIIITTAYQHYALDAFHINSIAFVLKPISKQSVQDALHKVQHYKIVFEQSEINIWPASQKTDKIELQQYIIRLGNRILAFEQQDVLAYYSKDKTTFLYIDDQKQYPIDYSLDEIEQAIDADNYYRLNRQVIIARQQIDSIKVLERSKLEIQTNLKIPVQCNISSEKSSKFKKWYARKK